MGTFISEFFLSYFYFILCLVIPGLITSLSLSVKQNSFLFHIISSFLLSIVLIHVFSFVAVFFKLNLSMVLYFLLAYSLLLLFLKPRKIFETFQKLEFTDCKNIIYLCLFFVIVMSFNGGLLVIFSDAWWHMSYANKINITNTIFLDRHHLTGIEIANVRSYLDYLPGWHLVLAVLQQSSGLALSTIWYNLTSFLVPLTLISYFLFVKSLTDNSNLAFISAILFSLLFGGLNSYFRISPWPGNVSYIVWYFLYYLSFSLLRDYQSTSSINNQNFFSFLKLSYLKNTFVFFLIIVSCYLIFTIHASEVFWFAVSFVFYYLISNCLNPENESVILDNKILALPTLMLILLGSVLFFKDSIKVINWDLVLAGVMIPGFALIYLILNRTKERTESLLRTSLIILAIFTIINIDLNQLLTLFNPVTEVLSEYGYHHPYKVEGYFGGDLLLPQWEHQLREGILFAGLISVIASLYLSLRFPNRATIFLFATSFFSILTIVSPYLFTFLNNFTPYTSTYRVHLLIFHPIVLSYLFYQLYLQIFNSHRKINEA